MTTKVTYRILPTEEREQDRLERQEKARRDQRMWKRWAIKQREIEVARNLLKMDIPLDKIISATNLTIEEAEGLANA